MIRPLGVVASEAERANRQAGSGSDFPSSDRAPRQSATPDLLWSPPRPQDLLSDAEMLAWDAAHSDAHTVHRCVLGAQHDGNCRCHCGKWFSFDEERNR